MSDVSVSDVEIRIVVKGGEVARFTFNRTDRHPQDWDVTASIYSLDTRTAVRACLLAAVAQCNSEGWTPYTFEAEGGSETNDQPHLPWE